MINREKNLETCLVIMTGLVALWFVYNIQGFLIAAIVIGIIGAFFNSIAHWINWLWYKLAELLGAVSSRVLLSIVFFLFLFPIALIYRLFNKDTLQLKKKENGSYWTSRSKVYEKKDLADMW